jgi:hypothetical protein
MFTRNAAQQIGQNQFGRASQQQIRFCVSGVDCGLISTTVAPLSSASVRSEAAG